MIKHIWFDFSDTLASIGTRIPRRSYILTDPNTPEVLEEMSKKLNLEQVWKHWFEKLKITKQSAQKLYWLPPFCAYLLSF